MKVSRYQKVEDVKRPLKFGELFLVPCVVKRYFKPLEDYDNFDTPIIDEIHINPVINNYHSDKENGQSHKHFHLDWRFIKLESLHNGFPIAKNKHSIHVFGTDYRPTLTPTDNLEYILLPVVNEKFLGVTPLQFIEKCTHLKNKCITDGKCPHKGYDLSQVIPVNGVIKCPLHGLEFNATNGKVINFPPSTIVGEEERNR
jgi:hypothetical protein